METVSQWWEIAQIAGAGAAVVLGPVAWMLWKRVTTDIDYARDCDRNTLKVLSDLTKVLENLNTDDESRHKSLVEHHAQILKEIENAVHKISTHIDSRIRPA